MLIASEPEAAQLQVIEPAKGIGFVDLGELWRYRELLAVLTWRNILVRYKQTLLGIAWAIVQPVMLAAIFTLVFAHFGGIQTEGIPAPIYYFTALLPWTFFQTAVTQSSLSLVANANVLRKVYLPRIVLPLSSVLTALVDFALAALVLAGLCVGYASYPSLSEALLLIPLVALAFLTALGTGLWLSALNVRYRDIQYVIPFLAQMWSFISFVQVPPDKFPEPWRTLFGLNPMAGVVTGFRAVLLGTPPPGPMIWLSVVVALVVLAGGLVFFRRQERWFADVV
jgi:lipopolysaccharide transport system permease protein